MLSITITKNFNEVRTWEINEYYIFIPIGIIFDYWIIGKIRKNRAQRREYQRLQAQLNEASEHIKFLEKQLEINKQQLKFYKITAVGLGISHGSTLALWSRGGVIEYLRGSNVKSLANYTQTDFKEFQPLIDELKASTGLRTLEACNIPSGLSFVNNLEFSKYVMKHIKNLHRYKQIGNVVVLSSAALCLLYNNFIREFAWVRVISNVANRAEIINVKQFVRRGIVVITWAAGAGLINFLELPLVAIAIYTGVVAVGNSFLGSTSIIPIEKAKSDAVAMARRPDIIDTMGLNLDEFIRNFIKYFEENWVSSKELVSLASAALECFLPDQLMANPNCKNNTTKEEILSNIPHILDKFLAHFLKARIDPEKIVTAKNVAVDSGYPVNEIGQDEAEIKILKAILKVRGGDTDNSISPAVFVNRDPIFWFIHLEKLKRQYNRAVFDFLTPASKFIVKKSKKVAQQTKNKIQKISQTKYRIKRIKSNQFFRGSDFKKKIKGKILQPIKSGKRRLQSIEVDRVLLQMLLGLTLFGFFGGLSVVNVFSGNSYYPPEFDQRPLVECVAGRNNSHPDLSGQNLSNQDKPATNPVKVSNQNPKSFEQIHDSFEKYGEGNYASFPKPTIGMSSNVGQNNQSEIAARPAPAVERYQQRRARIMELKRQRQQEDRQFASDFTRNLESQEYNQNFPNPAERMKIRIP